LLRASAVACGATAFTVLGASCSMVSMAYPRLADLTVWWVQRQVSLDTAQTGQLKQDAQALLDWHRQTQLASTVDTLRHWQTLVNQPLTAEQACTAFAQVRQQWDGLLLQAATGMLTLGRSLTPAQRDELAASQAKAHATFRKAYLPATGGDTPHWLPAAWTPATAADTRLDNLTERYGKLYGALTAAQTEALRRSVAQSSFDPVRTLAERERRTQDLLHTIRHAHAAPTEAEGLQAVRGWINRLAQSPTPGYTLYSQTLIHEGCDQFAQVHALATPTQLAHAHKVLAGYEADLRQLLPRR
ncbi:MAG: hypothetical protein K2W33_12970, partial [Burkholderiales bacterium]|nr:hypothetical protein [Burkholderiales bacterium]